MGKKAVGTFMKLTFNLVICLVSLITMAGYFVPFADPAVHPSMPFLGLAIPALLILCMLFIIWLIFKRQFVWLLFPVLAIAANYRYLSGTFQYSSPVSAAGKTMKIMTLNAGAVHREVRLILDDILLHTREEGVDVICFQEFNGIKGTPGLDSLFSAYPYRIEPDRGDGKLFLAVFSKYPITDWQMIPFENSCNDGLWCDLSIDGQTVRIVNVHMQTTSITQNRALIEDIKKNYVVGNLYGVNQLQNTIESNFVKRAEQARQVHAVVQSTRSPLILCGDFNDTPISYTYQTIRGNLLKDGFKSCGNGYGYTFHGFFDLLRIDFILYSQGIHPLSYYSLPQEWSDHNPVFMGFALTE